jgi:hypothetical protein
LSTSETEWLSRTRASEEQKTLNVMLCCKKDASGSLQRGLLPVPSQASENTVEHVMPLHIILGNGIRWNGNVAPTRHKHTLTNQEKREPEADQPDPNFCTVSAMQAGAACVSCRA